MIPLPAILGREACFLLWIYYQDRSGSILIGVWMDESKGDPALKSFSFRERLLRKRRQEAKSHVGE